METFFISISKYFLLIIKLPLWWYTVGFFNFFTGVWTSVKNFDQTIGFTIWLKNIFTTLFHQYDFSGRAVSFFIRLVTILIRGLILLTLFLIHVVLILFWLVWPVFVIYIIILHAIG